MLGHKHAQVRALRFLFYFAILGGVLFLTAFFGKMALNTHSNAHTAHQSLIAENAHHSIIMPDSITGQRALDNRERETRDIATLFTTPEELEWGIQVIKDDDAQYYQELLYIEINGTAPAKGTVKERRYHDDKDTLTVRVATQ